MNNDEIVEMHAIIGGRVQGVGFRATTLYLAQDLNLTGSVCNLPNGTVEINAQGSRQALQSLIGELQKQFSGLPINTLEYKTPGWLFPSFRITYVK